MSYAVHEIFHTLQGEGSNLGRPAVFVRFTGCNLWSGREEDRATAICKFCDTDFRGGSRLTLPELVDAVLAFETELVVFTGGEPALQLDQSAVDELRSHGRRVAIETNGTRPIPDVDWVCVSPKANTKVVVNRADELKLVFPQVGLSPDAALKLVAADTNWLSPMDGLELRANIAATVEYAKAHPRWRVNIQAHKIWSIR